MFVVSGHFKHEHSNIPPLFHFQWNYPIVLWAVKFAPAIAMGNVVVIKPAEQTPLTALYLATLAKEVSIHSSIINQSGE